MISFFTAVCYSVMIAFIAFTYSVILTDPNMLLTGWYGWLRKKIKREWVFKIIIGCAKCVSGQWALWFMFYYLIRHGAYHKDWMMAGLLHLFTISLTIFTVMTIERIYRWNQQS